jgi:hypothetical protein
MASIAPAPHVIQKRALKYSKGKNAHQSHQSHESHKSHISKESDEFDKSDKSDESDESDESHKSNDKGRKGNYEGDTEGDIDFGGDEDDGQQNNKLSSSESELGPPTVSFKLKRAPRNSRSIPGKTTRTDRLGFYSPSSQEVPMHSKPKFRSFLSAKHPFPSAEERTTSSIKVYKYGSKLTGILGGLLATISSAFLQSYSIISDRPIDSGRQKGGTPPI